jgi:hypothetical protein
VPITASEKCHCRADSDDDLRLADLVDMSSTVISVLTIAGSDSSGGAGIQVLHISPLS